MSLKDTHLSKLISVLLANHLHLLAADQAPSLVYTQPRKVSSEMTEDQEMLKLQLVENSSYLDIQDLRAA